MNPLKYSDFIQKDENTIQELIDQFKELLKVYKETSDTIKKQAQETAQSIRSMSGATDEQRESILKATETQEQLLKEYKDINSEQRIAKREINFLTQAEKEKNQIDKLIIQANKSLEGSYNKLSAQYRLLKIEINQMNDAEVRNGKTKQQLEKEAKALYEQMSKMQQATGKYTLEVGHYQNALSALPAPVQQISSTFKQLGQEMATIFNSNAPKTQKAMMALKTSILAVVAAVVSLFRGMKDLVNVNAEFEQANANLQSILGASRKDMIALTDTAMSLGRSTEWTASQVTLLQTELAKLGFGQASIIAMQKHVLAFATAVGADLGDAANVAGASIRAFNLVSADAERVMGTLAVAVNNSALTFERIKYAMGTVFPIASAFGLTIEDATAMLGTLANAGFSAESAATAMRNMLLKLADPTEKLAQRTGGAAKSFNDIIEKLVQLRKEGANLSEIFELTDKRSVAAFNALMSGTEQAERLRKELSDVNGELSRIQQTRLDTVSGQVKILKSYWEGFKLSLQESNGIIEQAVRNLQQIVLSINQLLFPQQMAKSQAIDEYLKKFQDMYRLLQKEKPEADIIGVLTSARGGALGNVQKELARVNKEIEELENFRKKNPLAEVVTLINLESLKRQRKQLEGQLEGISEAYTVVKEQVINDAAEIATQQELLRQEQDEKAKQLTREQKQQRLKDLQAIIDAIKMEIAATEKGDKRRKQLYVDLVNAERNLALEKNNQAEASAKINEDIINAMYDKEAEDAEKKYYNEVSKLREEDLKQQREAVQMEIGITQEGTQRMLDLRLQNIELQRQIEIEQNNQKEKRLRQDEADINAKYDKLRQDEVNKFNLTMAKRELAASQKLAEANFNMDRHNERQKTIFRLQQNAERLQALLDQDELAVDKMTQIEKDAIIAEMEEIKKEMKDLGYNNIYEVIGLKLDDKQQSALDEAFSATKDWIQGIIDKYKEAADAAVESADKQVEAAQKVLDAELEAKAQGYASSVEEAQKEVALAKKKREEALKEQQKAQKAQLKLDSIQQASSLITATANIWKAFGEIPVLAIAATALMWGSFIAAQAKARQLTKQEYGEGTVELLEGGSHASGNDIDLGYDKKTRKHRRAEGGEYFAIINKRNSRRYGNTIKDVITSFNNGTFSERYVKASEAMSGMATQIIGGGTDVSRLENDVHAIREQGDEVRYLDNEGRLVVKYKNLTKIRR